MTSNCSHQLRSSICRQLFRERLSGKECTRQSREVTWISGDIIIFIYNHYAFSLQWRFFPKILRSSNRDLKPTYNAFQGCRVHLYALTQPIIPLFTLEILSGDQFTLSTRLIKKFLVIPSPTHIHPKSYHHHHHRRDQRYYYCNLIIVIV